ncbi:MAG: hypothetical protein EOP10_04860 [Proteobacteria bacterium]|nr:MAG: hypothetical protein EOP10_04860 [Pseudomonadota bacterium]
MTFPGGPEANFFFSGALTALCLVVALFFLRFYVKSRDRLFLCFSCAFVMLGVERVFINVNEIFNEKVGSVILIRLASFILILLAIIDKNRRSI